MNDKCQNIATFLTLEKRGMQASNRETFFIHEGGKSNPIYAQDRSIYKYGYDTHFKFDACPHLQNRSLCRKESYQEGRSIIERVI